MANRPDDVADRRDLASRWCALAEQRLEYLTRLFESERWRRYYSELTFLQNIQEAKTAVETWRNLSVGRAIASAGFDNVQAFASPTTAKPVAETAVATEAVTASSHETPSAPEVDLPALRRGLEEVEDHEVEDQVLDLAAMQQRYPLLRNTL
jgi:uncharacterized repeat protein (TIGR03809 family)